jgi:hypothetical protein
VLGRGAAPADFGKRLWAVDEIAAVGLFAPDGDFPSQFGQLLGQP